MRMKWNDSEIEDLSRILENYDCLTEWEIEVVPRLLRKLKKATNYSLANFPKRGYLEAYRFGYLEEYKELRALGEEKP